MRFNKGKSSLSTWATFVLFVSIMVFMQGSYHAGVKSANVPVPIRCDRVRPMIRVRSSVDTQVYRVDICAVADSAEGEDFRTVDTASSKGEN